MYLSYNIIQDEMLLFMEYCSEGTVADAAKLGLAEEMIRKYTCEILDAVAFLHDKQVVHRDIKGKEQKEFNADRLQRFILGLFIVKWILLYNYLISHILGANIFLTPDGLKLGDFGCAVKLKNHTTLPGEFKTMAGTTGNYTVRPT